MLAYAWKIASALAISLALAACSPKATEAPAVAAPPPEAPARVFAASSLTYVLKAVGDAYAAAGHPAPVLNFASSSDLAHQIEQGAEADVFISADEAWMDELVLKNLIDPVTRSNLLTNKLVLVAPKDHPFTIEIKPGMDLAKALGKGKLVIANPDGVPAGRYAKESLEALGAWAAVEKGAGRAESVRAALRFVESGEAAAGIVFATDAMASADKVVVVGVFPDATHKPIVYPAARVANRQNGAGFADFLRSDAAKAAFTRAGFGVTP